jgi:hypothetical protein
MKISIKLKNDSERENKTKEVLERILDKYNLDKWIIKNEIIIEEGVISHSHPTITLNTRFEREGVLLSKFLHEQMHWVVDSRGNLIDEVPRAIEELKREFPNAPIGRPEGAKHERSTYSHLMVCRLELLATAEAVGMDKAKEVVLNEPFYTWIYRKVVEEGDKIDPIIKKYFPHTLN